MYKYRKKLAHRSNYGAKRKTADIKYLVYHYTGNDGDSDEGNANYFTAPNRQASAHWFVDDDSITRSVPANYVAWHCGDGKGMLGITNANSLSIEMCDTKRNGKHDISIETRANAIAWGRKLVKKYDIPESKVVRHYDASHKACPAYFCGSDIAVKKWRKFRAEIFMGYQIGSKYAPVENLKLRKDCGSEISNGKVGKGKSLLITEARWGEDGNLYLQLEGGYWVRAYNAKKKKYLLK